MFYKRSEGFRYEFSNPLLASFKFLSNGEEQLSNQSFYNCQILDVSPRGMKMFSDANFGEHTNKLLQLEVHFVLDEEIIQAIGDIVWEKPYAKGKQYGLIFNNQPKLEAVIISDLKARRRKEVSKK